MNERELRDRLREAGREDPEAAAAARERSLRVVRAAFDDGAARDRRRRPRRRRWAALLAAILLVPVAVGGAAAATTPDRGVGHWVRSVLGVTKDARPALVHVPGGGRLLVGGDDGVWVVSAGGTKRRLGAYSGASWSPRGLFVVAWRGRELTALEPGGRVRWSLPRPQRVHDARWAPVNGYRIAYLTGSELRIVYGDGTLDERFDAARRSVAPAWRPDGRHVLAYVDAGNRVVVAAIDTRRRLWRSAPLAGVTKLVWSPAGDRLLAVGRRRLVLFARGGRRLAARAVPAGFALRDAEWAPRGSRVAALRRRAADGRDEVVLFDAGHGLGARVLFGPGRFGALAWSPGGERLLVGWPEADQWLFLRPRGPGRLSAVTNIARQFDPGATAPPFTGAVEWCCRAQPPRRP
jgi:hypothetical protein